MYIIQDVPGKGKGLVATERICKGTRILCEEPLIRVDEAMDDELLRTSISQQVEALSEHHRRAFLSMHNIYPYEDAAEQYIGIVRTNSIPEEHTEGKGAIFLDACRINHACNNNAQKSWNVLIGRHTVHALRDIDKDEEITITYLSPLKNREVRQKALQSGFEFSCKCQLCSLPPKQSQESDERLDEMRHLDDLIDRLGPQAVLMSPMRTLGYFDRQAYLYERQGREDVGFARLLANTAQLIIANGDLARGRIFAEKTASVWETTLGGDDEQTIEWRALSRDPAKSELHGISKRWVTKVNEVPQTLSPGTGDFDDWLWRREKPKVTGQPANLPIFARFIDLPAYNDSILKFFKDSEDDHDRAQRHWCFIGEIVDHITLHHLEIELRDLENETIPLHFYTNDGGLELEPAQIRKGHTVAVLNAKRYHFQYGNPGIRHSDPRMLKIFPLSLHELLALRDQVLKFSVKLDGTNVRLCHGCGKEAATLRKCKRCLSFWYCDQTCQTIGWKEKGHKVDCKFLRDPDLRGLFVLKWDGSTHHRIQFPLPTTAE